MIGTRELSTGEPLDAITKPEREPRDKCDQNFQRERHGHKRKAGSPRA